MKLIVIEEKDIETVYQFEVNELEQMHVVDVELKRLLPVKRNNFILALDLFEIFICQKQLENQQLEKTKVI
jgi:hypothetical protein